MKRLISCVVVLVVLAGLRDVKGETIQWSGNGHWYDVVYVEGQISWEDARDASTSLGGYLATIHSDEENDFVFSVALSDPQVWFNVTHTLGPWLGGYQQPGISDPYVGWSWVSGEPFDYTNWGSNQPNDADAGGQSRMNYYGIGQNNPTKYWNDFGTPVNGYMVEFNTNPVPEPSTIAVLSSLGLCAIIGLGWRCRRTA